MFGKLLGKSQTQKFDYNEPDIGVKILSQYGDLMVPCIIGMVEAGQVGKLNEFCSHMAAAALQGDFLGVALSCFSQHEKPFNQYLPVPISSMHNDAFAIFVELLKNNIDFGFSKSAKRYLKMSRCEVEDKANEKNPYALWLMGAWYAFDDFETKGQDACMKERMYYYEKSAFGGYLPARKAVAGLYDVVNDSENYPWPADLKKSAFWYRYGALDGDPICAFNLGVIYAQGDSVERDLNTASMWLSLSIKNSDDSEFSNHVLNFSKQNGIQIVSVLDLNQDPELNDSKSEFQDAYETS